jgi:FkbM family methyltransferase
VTAVRAALRNAIYTFRRIQQHPLVAGRRGRAYRRWLGWQIGSRLAGGSVLVDYVHGTRLALHAGMHGATMNFYVGLDEVRAMGFLLHYLRPDDLFVDVGANVGAYVVLASGVVGARTVAFEPAPDAFTALALNVRVNGIEARVDCRNVALAAKGGTVAFTTGLDTLNHVLSGGEPAAMTTVDAVPLDGALAGRIPALVKLDAEGYEREILEGARHTLAGPELSALIVEIDANCRRYGWSEADVFRHVLDHGFAAVTYDPLSRRLDRAGTWDTGRGAEASTLFVRDVAAATARLAAAPRFRITADVVL